jgi:hypothetical protein
MIGRRRNRLDTGDGRRRPRRLALTVALAASAALALVFASSAWAGLKAEFAIFNDCPVENPEAALCIVSTTTSGEFHMGNESVPVTKPVVLQGALPAEGHVLIPAADGNTLSKTPLTVPGGLLGIELLGDLTEVTATAELAGPVEVNVINANKGEGVAASMPLKVKLDNPLLLNECRIGNNSEPIALNLTTGTTNPPPPNGPISGSPGTVVIGAHGKIFTITGSSLVDNAFFTPGANGCAGLLAPVVDLSIDLKTGLPSAAGKNTAILNGSLAAASVASVVGNRKLPDIGRCVKTVGVKEGGTTVYSGGYNDAGCTEELPHHNGKFEWIEGPPPNRSFTGTGGTATLETVGKKKVKCVASTTAGEYTGAKAATMNITFTGCTEGGEACQTSGASAGQINAPGLQATLGFIKEEAVGTELLLAVGWDLAHQPNVLTAECGAGKEAVTVTGSVIGQISAIDKMVSSYTVKLKASHGKQLPEAFEEEPKDTLTGQFGSSEPEQIGLTTADKLTGEKIEIKAKHEE